MPKLTNQEMIHAATDIMRKLGISEKHIRQFEQSGTVCLHVSGRVVAVYRGTNLFEMISAVERKRNVKIYAVIHSYIYPVGVNLSYLCVSPYAEDITHLVSRMRDPRQKLVYAYVENLTDERNSESGYIVTEHSDGVFMRVG